MPFHTDATFEITLWEEASVAEGAEAPSFVPVTVHKIFKGDLQGTSVAQLLMTGYPNDARAYIAVERLEVSIDGRSGSFDLHHCASQGGPKPEAMWTIVSGSGTGDFQGIYGTATYRHDADGAFFTLDYAIDS